VPAVGSEAFEATLNGIADHLSRRYGPPADAEPASAA
jgi:hypothetical protein